MPKQAAASVKAPVPDVRPRSISPEVSEVLHLIGAMEKLAISAAARPQPPSTKKD